MKIVSWNCNGKFREKFKEIEKINADIYIIQECEDPKLSKNIEYNKFAKNYIWAGENKKGLGIFYKDNILIKPNNWPNYSLRNFISVKVNNDFDLIGVWACRPYIEEFYIYLSVNKNKFNKKSIVFGDFNSNKIWDKKHGTRCHSNVVKELSKKGLVSAYHYLYNEKQGEESQKTFYLYRHIDKGYHIDHCFTSKDRLLSYKILDISWLEYSDHVPIILEIKEKTKKS